MNSCNNFGYTPIIVAVMYQNPKCIEVIIKAGADVNASSVGGHYRDYTVLVVAAATGYADCLRS